MSSNRTIGMSTKMELAVSKGALEYIAGVDPKKTWEPITDDNYDIRAVEELQKNLEEFVMSKENTKEFQEKMQDFMGETTKLFQAIVTRNSDVVRPYTAGKKFVFVLGMPRSGATTLYHGVSEAYGWPWKDLLFSMTHNYMPNGVFVQEDPISEYDMGWRLPWNFNNVLFELCQFLVYVNREATFNETVVLRSTTLSFATKLLNFLFADSAEYVIAVRHPGAVALTSGKEEVTREDHIHNMALWTNLYSSIMRECKPLGKITAVQYGAGMTEYLNELFEERKTGERLEDTAFFEYEDYDKEFYESESVQDMFEYVKASWKLFDMDFPMPDKCI
jgi:hypothetical protein